MRYGKGKSNGKVCRIIVIIFNLLQCCCSLTIISREKVVDKDIFYFTSSLLMFRFCPLAPYDYVMYKYFPFDSNPVSDFFVLL